MPVACLGPIKNNKEENNHNNKNLIKTLRYATFAGPLLFS